MRTFIITVSLLVVSNCFMTFAWYGHLKNLRGTFWLWVVLISWGIALLEYLFQVPANRIGSTEMTVPQLKILQEAIALTVFVPFSLFYLHQSFTWNYLGACCCILGAVWFIFH